MYIFIITAPTSVKSNILNFRNTNRYKGIKLVLKIFDNIINNPSQLQKYGDLNAQKICSKLSECKPAFNLLLIAGFKKSNNKGRLKWTNTDENIKALHSVHDALQSMMTMKTTTNPDQLSTYNELINSGFTNKEALAAIAISNDAHLTSNTSQPYSMSINASTGDMTSLPSKKLNDEIKNQWQCKICTLINDTRSTCCEACKSSRDGNNTYDDIQKLVQLLVDSPKTQVADDEVCSFY